MQPLTNIAVTAARRAGDVILSYYRRCETGEIASKGDNDFVTEADHKAEAVIMDVIERNYPEGMSLGGYGMPRYEITVSRVSESES